MHRIDWMVYNNEGDVANSENREIVINPYGPQ